MLLGIAGIPAAALGAGYTAQVTVARTPTTAPLPNDFLGLAFEFSTVPVWTNDSGKAPTNQVLAGLVHGLNPSGDLSLRIGGQSTERSWWPIPGMSTPIGVTYPLSPTWTQAAKALVQALDAKLLLGINLEANSPRLAQYEAYHLVRGIGRQNIDALEIGNEPDLYTFVPWYHDYDGRRVPWYVHEGTPEYARPPGYAPSTYIGEFGNELKVMPGLPIAGPETNSEAWLSAFSSLLAPNSRVRMITTHAYGLNNCVTNPSAPNYPSVPNLLSPGASRGLLSGLAPYVALAHRDGATFRVDEMGSVTCNGRKGVSNTMASALWATDALFDVDQAHADGVNLHTFPNSSNGLFDFAYAGGRWSAQVHPLYYGALMFARAAPSGSRLLPVTSTGPSSEMRTWATIGADHATRVLVVNDSTTSAATALIHVPRGSGSGQGTVLRLTAPSAYATGGISIGGRSYGARTGDGTLQAPKVQPVRLRHGAYVVRLPPASEALLTVAAPVVGGETSNTRGSVSAGLGGAGSGPTIPGVRTWLLFAALLGLLAVFSLTSPSLSHGQARIAHLIRLSR